MKHLVLTGGGSAGHAVPNAALIPALSERYELSYIGTDGIEKRIIAPYKIPYSTIKCAKFSFEPIHPLPLLQKRQRGGARTESAQSGRRVFKGRLCGAARRVCGKKVGLARAFARERPFSGACEQDHRKKVPRGAHEFSRNGKTAEKREIYGRAHAAGADKADALAKYGFSGQKSVLLVLGGGSGSKTVNEALRANLFALTEKFDVLHLCGRGNAVQSNARGYVQREYEEDMPSAYAAADIALSRAGAGAAFELIALKKPTLFVPLENKRTRGDQAENAAYFEARGLAKVLREKDLTPASLQGALFSLAEDEALKKALGESDITSGNAAILAEIEKMLP